MMSEFSFDIASDWDLQAIVKGTSLTNNTNTMNNNIAYSYDDAWFESLDYQGFANTTLAALNDPLTIQGSSTSSPHDIIESSTTNYEPCTKITTDQNVADESCAKTRAASISRRRKNKHKIIKMVQQEGGDRVLSDKWNWRKYGEKVIKGSPYPRSYYRCSYQGGCSARKQVEQSNNNSGLFLITYMEEHTHPYPTRRHSQAGRSAKRFNHSSSTKIVITNESHTTLVRTTTSESSSTKHDVGDLALRGDEEDVGSMVCVAENQDVCYGNNRVFEDDFFAGLDYLEGLCMNVCN